MLERVPAGTLSGRVATGSFREMRESALPEVTLVARCLRAPESAVRRGGGFFHNNDGSFQIMD